MVIIRNGFGDKFVHCLIFSLIITPQLLFAAETSESSNDQQTSITEPVSGDDAVTLQKFAVTGSHIKQIDIEGYSPVLTISLDDIEKSGSSTLSELLRDLPMHTGDENFDERLAQSFAPGSSSMSLRGLGGDATLILINGRRLASFPFAQNASESFVDLNSIPLGAIERIEVLKDGASAIYGSDAIAGVVNIILRKDYEESEVSLRYGQTSESDGDELQLSAVTGKTFNNGSNATFTFDYFSRESIGRADRDFSKSADHTAQGGSDFTSISTPVANVFDLNQNILAFNGFYDFNPDIDLIPETERYGAMLNFNTDLTANTSFFSDLLLNQTTTDYQYTSTNFLADVIVPATHPDNTFGQDTLNAWRMSEMGYRDSTTETTAYRVVAGLKGAVNKIDWNAAVNYSRSESAFEERNNVNLAALDTAINNGTINPYGTSPNPQNVLDSIRHTVTRDGESTLYGIDTVATAPLIDMQNGTLDLAVGAAWRKEEISDKPDSLTEQDLVVGVGGTSSEGDRDITSLFSELNMPILDNLEFQLAVRYEDYSDFGDTADPKLAVRYQALDSVLLRASWGTAFRAPSLPELHIGQTTGFAEVVDNARCAATGGAEGCTPDLYFTTVEGNPDLDAEESEAIYIGGVFEPVKNFVAALDYWQYDNTDVIIQDAQYTVDNYPDRVTRSGPSVTDPIVQIDSTFFNAAEQRTNGFDVDVKYSWKVTGAGTFSLQDILTRVIHFERKDFEGQDFDEKVGSYHYPKLRNTAYFNWSMSDYAATLTYNYISGYDDITPQLKVGSYTTYDLQAMYLGIKSSRLTLGVKNLFNKEPPYSDTQEGYDYATHDPRGRFYYIKYGYNF
ncbi:MAG: TonB-dependent receptor [Gammaproteobacteria bacterium]|nr:TonB-dependent receptor [Gammaproteobacteria bacterium]